MRRRHIVLLLPILVLSASLWFAGERAETVSERVPIRATDEPAERSETVPEKMPVWHISHDWIEIDPAAVHQKESARRETFGIGSAPPAPSTCLDPNCRACLIDFVYGREF